MKRLGELLKTITSISNIVWIVLTIGITTGSATNWTDKVYLNADAGVSLVQDVTIKNSSGSSHKAEFDPGIRGDISLGYEITDSCSVELEFGVVYNHAKSGPPDNALLQIPAMINAAYQISVGQSWVVYLGVGVGGVMSHLDMYHPVIAIPIEENHFTFAYQSKVGIKYSLSPRSQVDLSYNFFGTLDQKWSAFGLWTKADEIFTHSILVSFTWKF